MALEKIARVEGTAVHLPGDDLDTDRIIPARFMRCVTFAGLGAHLFHDLRFEADGRAKGSPLDAPERRGAAILVSGRNFGCGSSREHAPQALRKFGFRGLVAESFAEIFFGNCMLLGLPCVSLPREELARLAEAVERDAGLRVRIDLMAGQVVYGETAVRFEMREGVRQAFISGRWDPLGELLEAREETARLEEALRRNR